MIALVDALTCYDLDVHQIDILSIGCGESEMVITEKQVRFGGLWHWKEIISSAMHLAGQNALGQAGLLIGRDRLIRVDAPVRADPIALDDVVRAKTELPRVAESLVNQFDSVIAERFLATTAEPYKAFHGPRADNGAGRHEEE
jgi:hypothetical protein